MAEAPVSAIELALENQPIGALQIRVAALCGLVQVCDGYDINSIGVSVPSLTHAWSLPGPAFTVAFLWSSIGILVGALSAGPLGDRVGRKPSAGREPDDFRRGLAADRVCRLARDAKHPAVFHRGRDRRRVCRCRVADRGLRAAPPARADDHGELYRGAGRRLSVRPARRRAVAHPRLAECVHGRRHRAAVDRGGADFLAARVAALPGGKNRPVAARGGTACAGSP